jgi:1-acyl-sn-glycerol-3-phosphate acyltransferase
MVETLYPVIKLAFSRVSGGGSAAHRATGFRFRFPSPLRENEKRLRPFGSFGQAGTGERHRSLFLSLRNVYETLYVSAPTVVDAARGRISRKVCDDRLEAWASRVVRNAEILVSVRGREHIAEGATYVVMSNHQSHYDVAILYYVLGGNVRMVAKKELFQLPIFGRAIREAGFVSVDRKNTEKAIESLENAKLWVKKGTHLWIAPEGTRSETGELLPFKKGGFMIALATESPVLPITIRGTRDILPSGGLLSRGGVEVHVTIHPPIPIGPYLAVERKAGRDALMTDVRRAIASAL